MQLWQEPLYLDVPGISTVKQGHLVPDAGADPLPPLYQRWPIRFFNGTDWLILIHWVDACNIRLENVVLFYGFCLKSCNKVPPLPSLYGKN